LKTVSLSLTSQVAEKVTSDARFSTDALLAAIKNELKARKLFDESDARSIGTADILIDEYAMQRTSNVILFGNIISAGTLNGSVRVRDDQGRELQSHRIEAQARVSIPESGETVNPFGPLYRRFAAVAADNLAGTPGKSTEPTEQRPR
jgi:hypothetical protein